MESLRKSLGRIFLVKWRFSKLRHIKPQDFSGNLNLNNIAFQNYYWTLDPERVWNFCFWIFHSFFSDNGNITEENHVKVKIFKVVPSHLWTQSSYKLEKTGKQGILKKSLENSFCNSSWKYVGKCIGNSGKHFVVIRLLW